MIQQIQIGLTWKRTVTETDERQIVHERLEERHFELIGTVETNEPISTVDMGAFVFQLETQINGSYRRHSWEPGGDIRAHLTLQ